MEAVIMLKKIFLAILAMALFTTSVNECYGASNTNKFSDAEKAVLAYAPVYGYGSTDYAKEAGIQQSDITEIRQIIFNKFRDSFKQFCLSDESLNKLTNIYFDKLKTSMDISAKLKVADSKYPVITITSKVLSEASFEDQATNDPNIQAFAFAIMGMKNEGKTEADLRADATVQTTAQDCIGKFIAGLNFGEAKSMDFTCTKINGEDGKTYWAPQDTAALYRFIIAE